MDSHSGRQHPEASRLRQEPEFRRLKRIYRKLAAERRKALAKLALPDNRPNGN